MKQIGKNINYKIVNNTLTIEIDLSKDFGLSGSGKSKVIGTTSGNKDLGNNIKLGLNCYTPV